MTALKFTALITDGKLPEAVATRIAAEVKRLDGRRIVVIRDVFAEAKGNGYDVKAIRPVIKMRKMDAQEREE